MSSSRSRLRTPSLAVVALAASLVLLTQGVLVAHADDLETVPASEAVAVASAEPVDEAVEPVEVTEPAGEPVVEPIHAPSDVPASEAPLEAPGEAVDEPSGLPADEPTDEAAGEPAVETVAEPVDEEVADTAPASSADEAPAPTLSLVQENLPVETQDDYYVIAPGATLTIAAPGILGNDSDPEGDPFTAQQEGFTTWLGNTGYIGLNGQFGFTAAPGFTGTDTITYYTLDSANAGSAGTIYVTVQAGGDPNQNNWPDAEPDFYSTPHDTVLSIPSHQGTLVNDTDLDGDALTTQATSALTTDNGGTVWVDADGSFGYEPAPGFIGLDYFHYNAYDIYGDYAGAYVYIGVTASGTIPSGPNQPPTAVTDDFTTMDGVTLVVDAAHGALVNDSDPEGGALSVVAGTAVSQVGAPAVMSSDGSFVFTPKPGTQGNDNFTYVVVDEAGLTSTAYISIEITPFVPGDVPVVTDPGTDPPVAPGGDVPAVEVPSTPIVEPAVTAPTVSNRGAGEGSLGGSELASTGFTALPLGAASLGVLLIGALVIVVARRRRTR